jgi:hypothetical protein
MPKRPAIVIGMAARARTHKPGSVGAASPNDASITASELPRRREVMRWANNRLRRRRVKAVRQ